MCCTCPFSAAPRPTTAFLICIGEYSCTGRSRATTAQIAAPRACPSLSAESGFLAKNTRRSEEHTSELQSLMRISYAVFCLKKKKKTMYSKYNHINNTPQHQRTELTDTNMR